MSKTTTNSLNPPTHEKEEGFTKGQRKVTHSELLELFENARKIVKMFFSIDDRKEISFNIKGEIVITHNGKVERKIETAGQNDEDFKKSVYLACWTYNKI